MQRVASYAVASEYDSDALYKFLSNEGQEPKSYDGVLHVKRARNNLSAEPGDVFYFPYGCITFWGFLEKEEKVLLEEAAIFVKQPHNETIRDILTFSYSEEGATTIIEEEDLLIIGGEEPDLIKLSFSHALSQSVKLSVFEASVLNTIRQTHFLTEELASTGSIGLSRHKLAQQIGALFVERHSINLHSDILDTPEFFWRRPKFEPFYTMAALFMDIQTRLQILNRRSNVVYELYRVLSDELQHSHSSRLEWVVILLITVEVIFTMLREAHLIKEFFM
jgi:uncharacterized Rmd1/YagE family protein